MDKNFFKPKFRISKTYTKDSKEKGFIVSIRYWWLPFWFIAKHIGTALDAEFKDEAQAEDYINRRFNIITFEEYGKAKRN